MHLPMTFLPLTCLGSSVPEPAWSCCCLLRSDFWSDPGFGFVATSVDDMLTWIISWVVYFFLNKSALVHDKDVWFYSFVCAVTALDVKFLWKTLGRVWWWWYMGFRCFYSNAFEWRMIRPFCREAKTCVEGNKRKSTSREWIRERKSLVFFFSFWQTYRFLRAIRAYSSRDTYIKMRARERERESEKTVTHTRTS